MTINVLNDTSILKSISCVSEMLEEIVKTNTGLARKIELKKRIVEEVSVSNGVAFRLGRKDVKDEIMNENDEERNKGDQ